MAVPPHLPFSSVLSQRILQSLSMVWTVMSRSLSGTGLGALMLLETGDGDVWGMATMMKFSCLLMLRVHDLLVYLDIIVDI